MTGASRGIGLVTARMLATEGARVLMVARSESALQEAADACKGQLPSDCDGQLATLPIDVTAAGAAETIAAACRDRFSDADVLVNNAGASWARPLAQQPDAEFQQQWELHVMASLRLMRATVPAMADRGYGRVVNVCSIAGERPSQTNVAYSVSKAAQLALSRAFADAYAARGVAINAVAPGAVATDLWMAPGGLADQIAGTQGITREQAVQAAREGAPRGRLGEPEEIGAVIALLCSPLAGNVVGAAWNVDGGSVPTIF